MKKFYIPLFMILMTISGCATVIKGTEQELIVKTFPVEDAQCVLNNGKGTWQIASTPGSVRIKKSRQDLKIVCQKNGYYSEEMIISSKGRPMLLGGVVGIGVDAATGATFSYPKEIVVPLKIRKE